MSNDLAALLVQTNLLTPAQLKHASRIQQKLDVKKPLIVVLEGLKVLTREQILTALREQKVSLPLGQFLVELGRLSQADLEVALKAQKSDPTKRLGEVLLEMRFVDESIITEILSYQLNIPVLSAVHEPLDEPLVTPGQISTCTKHKFLPVKKDASGRYTVVFSDPLNKTNVRRAQTVYGSNIDIAVALPSAIHRELARLKTAQESSTSKTTDSETAFVQSVNQLIEDAIDEGASDVHLEPSRENLRVRFRLDGVLVAKTPRPAAEIPRIMSRLKVLANVNITERRRHQDGRIQYTYNGDTIDIRISFYVTIYGEKCVLRILNQRSELLQLSDIGFSPALETTFREDVLECPSGIVLVTGPTGSGKTTTLYAAISYLNSPETSIITAEDPVEYIVDGISQCSINPEIGVTFDETLKSIVRQDPDIIIIGEIRDQFSAGVAIQAALTGHKVLTTFHTEDTIGGLLRLLNMNIEAFLISSTVVSVLAQRLVRKICPDCATKTILTAAEQQRLRYQKSSPIKVARKAGCSKCNFTGYRGRLPIHELLVLNEHIKSAIIDKKTSYEVRRICIETSKMVTLLEDGIVKASLGLTSYDEIIRALPRLDVPRSVTELSKLLGINNV